MAVMKKGNFSIDIGFLKLGADFEESDRQCAWELYTELATRIAVTGKSKDRDCTDFSGEVYAESLSSLHTFFGEARKIMRQFPVCSTYVKPRKLLGIRTGAGIENHLGALIHRAMRDVLRPFLETWQAVNWSLFNGRHEARRALSTAGRFGRLRRMALAVRRT